MVEERGEQANQSLSQSIMNSLLLEQTKQLPEQMVQEAQNKVDAFTTFKNEINSDVAQITELVS